jgi:hypothetical protein
MLTNSTTLSINYSPDLDLQLSLASANRYQMESNHHIEYLFEVKCRLRHPTGYFDYSVDLLAFSFGQIKEFAEGLREIHEGTVDSAKLESVGEMFVLQLTRTGRSLRLALSIREFIPPDGSASLNSAIGVDYDLFVNKLREDLNNLLRSLDLST